MRWAPTWSQYQRQKYHIWMLQVMVFAVLNTWLMAKKILENWLYWIVIDTAAIILFIRTGYYATIAMMIVYIVLAVFGFIGWKKNYDQSLLKDA